MDEKDLLQIKIDEAKSNLSPETTTAISNIDWRTTVLGMREKRGYSFSQLEDLETETELLLYGLVKPEDYPKELMTRMHIAKEEADELINELNNLIFQKIREELVKNAEHKVPEIRKEIEAKQSEALSPDASVKEAFREDKNTEVLNQSGINIIEAKQSEALSPDTSMEVSREKRDEMLNKVENPNLIISTPREEKVEPSLLNQKLNNAFKIPTAETKYTETPVKHSAVGSKSTDPYREAVE